MAIRIIENGNPAREILNSPKFDECVIESTNQNFVSIATFKKNGEILDRQKMYDSDVSEIITETEFSSMRYENGDIVLTTRQAGEDEMEIEELPVSDDIIVI